MKHIHKEAFCLMTYAADDGSETETLWNSRDGVTPFGISSVSGKSMHHVDWQEDKYCPDFVPPPGMRIFVDATLELVTPELNKYVETIFSEYEGGCWKTRQEAFDALLPGWLYNGEAPWVITVPHASAPAPQSQVSRPIVASFDAMDEECANPEHSCHNQAEYVRELSAARLEIAEKDSWLERLIDLVRYQRSELFEAKLIDEQEYAALVEASEGGQRVARLEGYDKIRDENAALKLDNAQKDARIAELEGGKS